MAPKIRRRVTAAKKHLQELQEEEFQKIPRPFEVINNLPVSLNPPDYSILANPLSTKDSGVLYSALLRSRKAWLNPEAFTLYWTKSIKMLESSREPLISSEMNARDTMSKLCDCSMTIGPHSFDVRLFILKDKRSEKVEKNEKKDKTKTSDKNDGTVKIESEINDQSDRKDDNEETRDTSSLKGKVEVPERKTVEVGITTSTSEAQENESLQPVSEANEKMPLAPSIENTSVQEPSNLTVTFSKESKKVESLESGKVIPAENESTDSDTNTMKYSTENRSEEKAPSINEKKSISTRESKVDESSTSSTSQIPPQSPTQNVPQTLQNPNQGVSSKSGSIIHADSQSLSPLKEQVAPHSQLPRALQVNAKPLQNPSSSSHVTQRNQSSNISSSSVSSQQSSNQTSQSPAPITQQRTSNNQKSNNQDIMQTPENHIMIANLNAIARIDPSLNTLMKIVASGSATPEQIFEFQQYIQKAREMGTQGLNYFRTSSPMVPRPISNKVPKEVKVKPAKPPKPPKKPKIPKEQKLTAFQEKYLDNATICFEFMENSNVRYLFPKDAIVETLPDDGIIVSFIVIHNREEVEEYEKAIKERDRKLEEAKKAEEAKREEEAKKIEELEKLEKRRTETEDLTNASESKDEESKIEKNVNDKEGNNERKNELEGDESTSKEVAENKSMEGMSNETDETVNGVTEVQVKEEVSNDDNNLLPAATSKEETLPRRRAPPSRKAKKKKGHTSKSKVLPPKEPELIEPEIKYTTISILLENIPARFSPIIENSVNKLEAVQVKMKSILEKGHRAPSYYLWYKVDSKQDEELAENLRVQLHMIENPGKAKYKKRVAEGSAVGGLLKKPKGEDSSNIT